MTPAPPFRFAHALGLVGERPRNSATYRRGQARCPRNVCGDIELPCGMPTPSQMDVSQLPKCILIIVRLAVAALKVLVVV